MDARTRKAAGSRRCNAFTWIVGYHRLQIFFQCGISFCDARHLNRFLRVEQIVNPSSSVPQHVVHFRASEVPDVVERDVSSLGNGDKRREFHFPQESMVRFGLPPKLLRTSFMRILYCFPAVVIPDLHIVDIKWKLLVPLQSFVDVFGRSHFDLLSVSSVCLTHPGNGCVDGASLEVRVENLIQHRLFLLDELQVGTDCNMIRRIATVGKSYVLNILISGIPSTFNDRNPGVCQMKSNVHFTSFSTHPAQ